MQKIAHIARAPLAPSAAEGRLAVWNRRLLIAATMGILWAATVLALQAVGPVQSASLAGEGMQIIAPGD